MLLISEVIAFLEKFAPPELAETWDNTGLLVGRTDSQVKKIMTCLTLTPDVAEEAMAHRVDLIVSHHPVLFRGTKRLTDATVDGKMLLDIIEQQIAVYSPHTSFDSAAAGINQQLALEFGLHNIQAIRPSAESALVGSGRWGSVSEVESLEGFLKRVGKAVGAEYVEFCGSLGSPVHQVAVACGSAGEFLADAIGLKCDTFVTGETRFHSALEARAAGVNLILLGHYSSERQAVESLAEEIARALPGIEVFPSRCERDPLSVFQI